MSDQQPPPTVVRRLLEKRYQECVTIDNNWYPESGAKNLPQFIQLHSKQFPYTPSDQYDFPDPWHAIQISFDNGLTLFFSLIVVLDIPFHCEIFLHC